MYESILHTLLVESHANFFLFFVLVEVALIDLAVVKNFWRHVLLGFVDLLGNVDLALFFFHLLLLLALHLELHFFYGDCLPKDHRGILQLIFRVLLPFLLHLLLELKSFVLLDVD